MRGWWRQPGWAWPARVRGAADPLLALAVAVLGLAQLAADRGPSRPADLLGAALLVLLCAPLAVRGRHPRAALTALLAAVLPYVLLGYPQAPLGPPLVVGVYTVGTRHGPRASAGVLALVVAALGVAFAVDPGRPGAVDLVVTLVSVAAAWGVGAGVRLRRTQLELVEERAALREQARLDAAARAVAQERLRIARELHDVVAHSMSVVAVQSAMASQVLATRPRLAADALAAISATSRDALGELRRVLGVLRSPDDDPEGLAPVAGLADLPALADRVRDAGVPVELAVTGDAAGVPAGAGLSAYRIVQEALTNAVRHAGPGARARVEVGCGPAGVDVLVTDDGGGVPLPGPAGSGRGLVGMRERVDVFGGDLEAGPVDGGGWRVAARLRFGGGP
ncbi:MAG: histidine kinase [Pseudonocardiales bacterium]|nr:histidine kinase [Pseudonocardiales bacterium]